MLKFTVNTVCEKYRQVMFKMCKSVTSLPKICHLYDIGL